jgi:hypothetical protein
MSEKAEKLSPPTALREAIVNLTVAGENLNAPGLDDDELTDAAREYASAATAYDKAVAANGAK